MNAAAVIDAAAPDGIPVRAVRFENAAEASGPSILWRIIGRRLPAPTMEPAFRGPVIVELECRAPTHAGARSLAADILAALLASGRLSAVENEQDERSDASSLAGGYYSRVVVLEIA